MKTPSPTIQAAIDRKQKELAKRVNKLVKIIRAGGFYAGPIDAVYHAAYAKAFPEANP